jgi:plastocyanin
MYRIVKSFALGVALAAAVLLLGACGSSAAKPAASASDASKGATIAIHNFMFSPATLTVKSGTTVTVKNTDDTAHTVTALDGSFDTGTIAGGKTATFTVSKAGTFKIHCNIHNYMTGTIQVTG